MSLNHQEEKWAKPLLRNFRISFVKPFHNFIISWEELKTIPWRGKLPAVGELHTPNFVAKTAKINWAGFFGSFCGQSILSMKKAKFGLALF